MLAIAYRLYEWCAGEEYKFNLWELFSLPWRCVMIMDLSKYENWPDSRSALVVNIGKNREPATIYSGLDGNWYTI